MAETITGILKRVNKTQFAVRTAERSYRPGPSQTMVQPDLVERFALTEGASVSGPLERKKGKSRLVGIDSIGGTAPEMFGKRPRFTDLVAIDPHERFDLGGCFTTEGQPSTMSSGRMETAESFDLNSGSALSATSAVRAMRIVDLIAPIGKGTRQLIVSPPKAGKTVLLEQTVQAIRRCSPESRVIVLLVDERPEEVTHFRRAVEGAEVVASASDYGADQHAELAELMLAHVQTELECGRQIVLLIDSLTRMGRAFNNRTRRGGAPRHHTMSGGLEAGILEVPRRLFGLARKIENRGSSPSSQRA